MDFLTVALFSAALIISLTSVFMIVSGGQAKLPPGSFGWPIIGETIDFLYGKPEKFVGDRMRKYSPHIFKTKILGEKTVVICGPNGHKFLFSNEEKYFTAFRPNPMQHLFQSYQNKPDAAGAPSQPTHESKIIRQPRFLKPKALMRFLAKMDSITQQQLRAHWSDETKTVVEVYPLAKIVTLTIACHFFLGINNPERISRLVKHFDDVTVGMHSIMITVPGTKFYRANKAADAITKELMSVIKDKKQSMASGSSPMHDVLSHMIVAMESSRKTMAESEIARKMMGLLIAGYSTVATTITFLMKFMGLNSQVYERVRAEQMEIARAKKAGELLGWEDMAKMKYSWNVVSEAIRLVPPLQGTFREVLQEFTYAGYTIPKGWKVYWTVSTTNRNPEYFRDPEKFNPSRYEEGEVAPPPYTYVPFGGGPRMCPGKEYARLVILTFIHNVVKTYRWEVMDPNEKIEGDMMPAPQMGLPIRLHHH